MENIVVTDNFLEAEELKKALSIIQSKKWKFGHKSLHQDNSETPFWSTDLMEEPYFTDYVKELIEKQFQKKFEIVRIYANGQTFGQDGTYHVDDNGTDKYTFCLYLSEIEKRDVEVAGGHIYFKFPDKKYQICYEPILNRGIFFPSNYRHKATSFSRYIMAMRICVTWKLRVLN